MAKKFYVPWLSNNQSESEEVKKWYAPWQTGNQWLSAKVVKAYCSQLVNNQWVSKLFYLAQKPWNDYTGQRLVYDHDYQAGSSYSVNRVGIIATFKYAVNKTIAWDKDAGYEQLYSVIQSKMSEMISYIQNLLISSDNSVIVQMDYSNYNSIYILLYIGHSNVSNIAVTSVSCGQTFKWIFWDTTNFGNSRIYIRFTLNDSGSFSKTYDSYSRSLGFYLGNYHDVYGQAHNYLHYVTNIGVHFEDFNSGDIIAEWDFRISNYDSVEGIVGCKYVQYGSSTIDSSGLHMDYGDYCDIPSWLMRFGNTLEIEFGDYSPTSNGAVQFTWFNKNSALFSFDPTSGVGWKLFDSNLVGTREETIGNTNINLFKNSTFKFRYNDQGYIEIYKNNTKLYTSHIVKMTNLAKTGSKACIGQVGEFNIKTMKIYNS